MRIVLLGAPASGKGTMATLISKDFGIPHISTGALFRESILAKTSIGEQAQKFMKHGKLVPDGITCALVQERIALPDCKNGFILDGFPRNLAQAKFLDKIASPESVILLQISRTEVLRRILGRRTCPNCGQIYNIADYKNPACEKCGSTLMRRDDDNDQTVKKRYAIYAKETTPLLNFYGNRVLQFAGRKKPEELYEIIKRFIILKFKQ